MKRSFYSMLLATAVLTFPFAASATDYTSLSSKDVQIVQQALADAGFYRAGVDGLYGPMTVNGIASFQTAKGLPATGQLDDVTLRSLSPQYATLKQVPDPETVKIFIAEETARLDAIAPASGSMAIDDFDRDRKAITLNAGEIESVQTALHRAGYYRAAPIDGSWGPVTTRAVREFQRDQGLDVTGMLNEKTLNALSARDPSFDKTAIRDL